MMLQRDYNQTNFITSLRAIAILFVFLIHSGGGGLREIGKVGNFFVDSGKFGVQIFFVISGFTIFSQFFSEKYSFKNFLLVRISRISIPYYPIIIILFIYLNLGGPQFNSWSIKFNNGSINIINLIAHILYISPYYINFQNTIIGVEWTIGIEVFFYILFGLLIHFKLFKLQKSSFILFGILFLIINILFKLLGNLFYIDSLTFHWMPFSYGYIFFLGGLAYYLKNKFINDIFFLRIKISRELMSDIILSIIIIFFIIISINLKSNNYSIVDICFVFATFLIIVFFNNNGILSKLLNNKILFF